MEELTDSIARQSGSENGIDWCVCWDNVRNAWLITCSDGKKTIEKKIGGHAPRFGVDIEDSILIDNELDKMLNDFNK